MRSSFPHTQPGMVKGDSYPFGKVLLKITQDRRAESQVILESATRLADRLALSSRLGECPHIMLSLVGVGGELSRF